ncbi:MAG TPA: LamG-like jellyroll fold domain-containing protein [Mucilaginibacter sp.]|nr:LamG-like jellyroll fold domain-containing protein [Mucilaginibacter sp.]
MKTFLLRLFVSVATAVSGQTTHNYNTIKPKEWVFPETPGLSYGFETYRGAKALVLKKNFNSPKAAFIAYPKDLDFRDGEIELDIASATGNDYLGLAFRVKDAHHYETLYFRPASSGTINAVQYMPEKQADFNWWDYEADKYQAKATLPARGWFHIKAVVKGRQLTVYINGQSKPAMVYTELDPEFKEGSVGCWFGNSAACAYKNLVIKTY